MQNYSIMITTSNNTKGPQSHDTESKSASSGILSYLFSSTTPPVESKEELKMEPAETSNIALLANSSLSMLGSSQFSNKVFTIRLTKSAQHTTSGAGALALATPVYPSSFLQYAQLSSLFNQCRIKEVRVQMISNINPNSSSGGSTSYAGGTLALAFLPRSASSVSPTTTIADVVRAPGVKIYNPLTITAPVVVTYRFPKNMPWSNIASTADGDSPISSTYGYFGHASIGAALTASTAYTTYVVEALYDFRAIT